MTDRGVSEVVSFVLVFSLVITSVGLVSTVGYSALSDIQASQEADNGALAFEVLAADVDAIESGRAQTQSADIGTSSGTLGTSASTAVSVAVAGRDWNVTTGSLFFRSQRTTVAYQSGAVVRQSGPSAVISAPPDITCTPGGVAVVSLVSINSTSSSSVSGTSVRVVTRQESSSLLYPTNRTPSSPVTVEVRVESEMQDAWARYFEESDGWTYDSATETASCSAERVIVRQTNILVDFRV